MSSCHHVSFSACKLVSFSACASWSLQACLRLLHLGALSGLGWDGIDWNGMVASLGQGANKEYFCAADYCFCQLWQKSSHERKSSSEGPPDHVMSVRGSEGQRVRGSEGFWKSGRAGQLGYKKVGFSQS